MFDMRATAAFSSCHTHVCAHVGMYPAEGIFSRVWPVDYDLTSDSAQKMRHKTPERRATEHPKA